MQKLILNSSNQSQPSGRIEFTHFAALNQH